MDHDFFESLLQKYKNMVTLLNEKVVLSKRAVTNKCFEKYGLTDAVIVELSQKKYLVITDDFKLSNLLYSINIDVINFNHIRGYRWLRGKKENEILHRFPPHLRSFTS